MTDTIERLQLMAVRAIAGLDMVLALEAVTRVGALLQGRPDEPGRCRYCGCTEASPCVIFTHGGGTVACTWADEDQLLCSNMRCVVLREHELGSHSKATERPGARLEEPPTIVLTDALGHPR